MKNWLLTLSFLFLFVSCGLSDSPFKDFTSQFSNSSSEKVGYFTLEELNQYNLDYMYNEEADTYNYFLEEPMRDEQSSALIAQMSYLPKGKYFNLNLFFFYEGSEWIDLINAVLLIDKQPYSFEPYSREWLKKSTFLLEGETVFEEELDVALNSSFEGDAKTLKFLKKLISNDKPKKVEILFLGKSGKQKITLSPSEVATIARILEIYLKNSPI